MVQLIGEMLPKYVKASPFDIQVLTPMRKGSLGVETLNGVLQSCLNPPSEGKKEVQLGDTLFREGDKVMQIKTTTSWNGRSSAVTASRSTRELEF